MTRTRKPTAAHLAELDDLAGQYKAFKAQAKEANGQAGNIRGQIITKMQALGVEFLPLTTWRITVKTTQRSVSIANARKILKLSVLRKILKTVVVMEIWDELRKTGEITEADEKACMTVEPINAEIYVYPVKAESKSKTAA